MEVVYSRARHPLMEGRTYQNPLHFTAPLAGAGKVFVVGDYPVIVSAYEAAGVDVTEVDKAEPETLLAAALGPAAVLSEEERGSVFIPDDWRDLPWTQRAGETGASLRALASSLSDEPIINKAQAVGAIEAELERRGDDD